MAKTGKLARNERRKLEASTINGVGLAVLIGGFVEFVLANGLSPEAVLRLIVYGMVALCLHLWAKSVLGDLED